MNTFYLNSCSWAHIVLKHNTVQPLRWHRITQAGQQVTWVGVIDQHSHRADHHRQIDKVFPAESTPHFILVAGATENHRHINGRVEQQRPGLQWLGGPEEEEEMKEQEWRRSPHGEGHVDSLVPGKRRRKREEGREEEVDHNRKKE